MDLGLAFFLCVMIGLGCGFLFCVLPAMLRARRDLRDLEAERRKIDADWNAAFAAYLSTPPKGKDHE